MTTTTVIAPTTTQQTAAIPVAEGSVLGKTTAGETAQGVSPSPEPGGETLGETEAVPQTAGETPSGASAWSRFVLGGGILVVGVLLYVLWKRTQNRVS